MDHRWQHAQRLPHSLYVDGLFCKFRENKETHYKRETKFFIPSQLSILSQRQSKVVVLVVPSPFTFLLSFQKFLKLQWRKNRARNSYKPINNTTRVCVQLCKLQKGCTRVAAASDKVNQLLARDLWFFLSIPASSTTKTCRHDIAKILLKVALSTINQIKSRKYSL